jgi:hypothetical protein
MAAKVSGGMLTVHEVKILEIENFSLQTVTEAK